MDSLAPCLMAYLLGAVPVGRMLTRLQSGEDVWEYGNGTATFNNLLSILGAEVALLKTLLDFLKGAVIVIIAKGAGFDPLSLWFLLVALLLGYIRPLGKKGREGTGLIPGLGYMWLMWPELGGLNLAWFWCLLMLTRRMKVAVLGLIPVVMITGLLSGNAWATVTAFTIIGIHLGNLHRQKPSWTITGAGYKA